MVKAILEGRKTMTRRVIKQDIVNSCDIDTDGTLLDYQDSDGDFINPVKLCRYKVDDILWVRETWRYGSGRGTSTYQYRADWTEEELLEEEPFLKWKPSIHMPKEAARIFLKVTNVRVERLQDITEEDAFKEGCIDYQCKIGDGKFEDVIEFDLTARDALIDLWDSLNAKRGYSWENNPWVWVIEFEKI